MGPRDCAARPCDRMRIDLHGLDASLRNRGAFHCTSDAPMCNPRPSHCIQLARFGKSSHSFVGLPACHVSNSPGKQKIARCPRRTG